MKKTIYIFIMLIVIVSCKNKLQEINEVAKEKTGDFIENSYNSEFIVKVVKGSSLEDIDGIKVISRLDLVDSDYLLIKKRDDSISTDDFIEKINSNENVVYVEKNALLEGEKIVKEKDSFAQLVKPFAILDGSLKDDEDYDLYGYALEAIKATDYIDEDGNKQSGAYTSEGYGGDEALVAIIDSGLNMNHRDFYRDGKSICLYAKSVFEKEIKHLRGTYYDQYMIEGNKLRELEVPSNEDIGDSDIIHECGHGTHCAGSICAQGENGGILGVAWKNAKIISYKAFSVYNYGVTTFAVYGSLGDLADIVAILRKEPSERTDEEKSRVPKTVPRTFKITQKTVPLNMSIGGPIGDSFETEMLNKAISVGILPVVAMGNDGRTRSVFPVSTYGVLGVGATDRYDKRAFFSNSGAWISVCAPGSAIVSTSNGHWSYPKWEKVAGTDEKGFSIMSGTSMATPCVTGLITYLLSFPEARNLTSYQIKEILQKTADKIDKKNNVYGVYNEDGYSQYYGYGRVNALEAVKVIKGKSNITIPEKNSFYIESPLVIKTSNSNIKVFLYEEKDMRCVGIGRTGKDTKQIKFYGLKNGCSYIVRALLSKDKLQDWRFTCSSDMEMQHEFK